MARFQNVVSQVYEVANRRSGGRIALLRRAIARFSRANGPEAASSLAYFGFFALFPLFLLLFSLAGFLVESEQAFLQVYRFVRAVFPVQQEVIQQLLQDLVNVRGTVGLLGLLGAFWSSSGLFNVLVHNINRAWSETVTINPFRHRLLALGIVGILTVLLLLSLLASTVGSVLPSVSLPFRLEYAVLFTGIWKVILILIPWLTTFLMFVAIYRWIPFVRLRWRAIFWSAIFATVTWELAKYLFGWYLRGGLFRLNLVYGSVSALLALMLWMYISGYITLLGAHLCATLDEDLQPASQAG
jgi:YihY family inner membrane protein